MAQRILIVDDNEDSLIIFSLALKSAGYEVITAKAGKAIWPMMLQWRPDLVLLDIQFPKLDGFSICHIIKSSPLFRPIPVLMISPVRDVDARLGTLCRDAGAEELMVKPIEPKDLIVKIGNYLNPGKQDSSPLSA